MKKIVLLVSTIACLLVVTSALVHANEASIDATIAAGADDSVVYQLSVKQEFDPFYEGDLFDLTPSLAISAHAWDPDNGDAVWGATIPLGLRFRMFTTAGFRPYIAGFIGPTFLSDDKIGHKDLGSDVLIMTRSTVGVSFGDTLQHRVEGSYTNHSTWGVTDTDPGYHTWGVGYGYTF